MEGLAPRAATEPPIPAAAGSGALRTTIYGVLAVVLLAGAWVRFNPQIAAVVPMLAGPAAEVADQMSVAGRLRGLVDVELLPVGETAEAVAAMGLPPGDAAALTASVRRGRLRLVRLPLFDLSADLSAVGDAGRAVEVRSGGYVRVVRLMRQPVSVTLPIGAVGEVSFSNLGAGDVGIGALTLAGPVRLPDLPAGQAMDVGVVAQ